MDKLLLLLITLALVTAKPVTDDEADSQEPIKSQEQAQNGDTITNYVTTMMEVLKKKYQNVTPDEAEKVRMCFEEFLINFANDLAETMHKEQLKSNNLTSMPPEAKQNKMDEQKVELEKINDNIPDSNFQALIEKLKQEYPEMSDDTAREIIFKLRKHMYLAKMKMHEIAKESPNIHLDE